MSDLNAFKRLSLIGSSLVVLLLLFGAGVALAADKSTDFRTVDDRDNIVDFVVSYPKDCWTFFDTIYYKEDVWESFVKKDDRHNPDDEIAVWVSHCNASEGNASKPTHYRVVEPGQTWEDSNSGDRRRPNAARFAVFKDKLFLFVAKTYDYDTGMILWQKQIAPLPDGAVDPSDTTRWNPPGKNLWQYRPNDAKNPRVVRGLVVKVMNDTLYILVQLSNTRDLYLLTSKDAVTYTRTKIHTFAGDDCLLNGDVVARGTDGAPLLAFVTKNGTSTDGDGTCKLWTFDPATSAVSLAATLPDKYKELTVVAGNSLGCALDSASAPYGKTSVQLWGIGWDTNTVYHSQCVLNGTGTAGTFNPGGRVSTGASASSHIGNSSRNRLASCIAPEQTADGSLQQYARIWWWGSTDDSGDNAHGRSMKYTMDLLQKLPTTTVDMTSRKYSPAWVLLGVIYGLPPYYNNGVGVGSRYLFYSLAFGLDAGVEVGNQLVSEKTLTLSYSKDVTIKGHQAASMGLSYTNAVQQTRESTATVTTSSTLSWPADDLGNEPGNLAPDYTLREGSQAWGVFLVPTITNERYHVYGPGKSTDLGVEVYYTYISGGGNLVSKKFDKTNTENTMEQEARDYWRGIKAYPNSLDYRSTQWTGPETFVALDGTTDYKHIIAPLEWDTTIGNGTKDWDLSARVARLESQTSTNTINAEDTVFGFGTGVKGAVSIGSSTTTTFGEKVAMRYSIPPLSGNPKDLVTIDYDMYLLKAETDAAFWIPPAAKANGVNNDPWCMTWHVNYWLGADRQQSAPQALMGNIHADLAASVPLTTGIRTSLIAKLKAARSAYDRGQTRVALNNLHAARNQISAQSGKAIPAERARRWIRLLDLVRMQLAR